MKRAVIFANGELHNAGLVKACLSDDDFLIAADGGHRHMKTIGLQPHLVIGDLDSLPNDERQAFVSAGVEFITYPVEKDETDLELALKEAISRRFTSILVVAALGGRLDHTLGNLSLLAAPFLKESEVSLEDGSTRIWLMTSARYPNGLIIEGQPGDRISLTAFNKQVDGIVTRGLKYPLLQEYLLPYQTRGISNVMMESCAVIQIEKGQLLVIHTRDESENERS